MVKTMNKPMSTQWKTSEKKPMKTYEKPVKNLWKKPMKTYEKPVNPHETPILSRHFLGATSASPQLRRPTMGEACWGCPPSQQPGGKNKCPKRSRWTEENRNWKPSIIWWLLLLIMIGLMIMMVNTDWCSWLMDNDWWIMMFIWLIIMMDNNDWCSWFLIIMF